MVTKVLKRKSLVNDPVDPAVTPPPTHSETTFLTKPKLSSKSRKRDMPEGLWTKCEKCEALIYDKDMLLEPAPKQPPLRPNVPGDPTPAVDA